MREGLNSTHHAMGIIELFLEVIFGWLSLDDGPYSGRVGESEMERRSRAFRRKVAGVLGCVLIGVLVIFCVAEYRDAL
jgi:hypothetical protein